jgi:uncharacterized SAM-binding protein YcdF (DUF218 family)
MFFILSKILVFLIQPICWLVALLAWAFFTKNASKKRRILRILFFLTIALTNPFLKNQTFRFYETPAVPMSSLRDTFDVGIVLGGFSNFDVTTDERLNFNSAANRLTDAVVLYKKGIVRKLLISGGDGNLLGKKSIEAEKTEPFLLLMGVRQEDILLESNSRNTHENALFSKALLDSQRIKSDKILMITSAFHTPRALGCFKKVGLKVEAFPAHFIGATPDWSTNYWLKPDAESFNNWETIIKEWVGYGAYFLKGYI